MVAYKWERYPKDEHGLRNHEVEQMLRKMSTIEYVWYLLRKGVRWICTR